LTANELVLPVLGAIVPFICGIAILLLGFALLHMIGKTN
jgi:hypothetical protein